MQIYKKNRENIDNGPFKCYLCILTTIFSFAQAKLRTTEFFRKI